MRTKIFIIIMILIFICMVITSNNLIFLREEVVILPSLPSGLNGLRIVHLSDLHNHTNKSFQNSIIQTVKENDPDLIVFTGDLIDSKTKDYSLAVDLLTKLQTYAPVFFVPGNHEYWSGNYQQLFVDLHISGIQVLLNDVRTLSVRDHFVTIVGIDDPTGDKPNDEMILLIEKVREISVHPIIILAHRPEYFADYSMVNDSLILAGHAHGGQFNIPFIGPIISPGQGLFPKYTKGPYQQNSATMIVSRGLGNSIIPIRINNPPEIVLITLTRNITQSIYYPETK